VDAARKGDRAALEALLEAHEARIYKFALKMCRSEADAQDTLQDTMMTAVAEDVVDPAPEPEAAVAGKEIAEALEIAIDRLAPMYREVLVLRDGEA
jgi:RNA polymerase sigma-70 factor (ECF subfamily)